MTKLTHTSVFPILQRQSVPLVCTVFNDKICAAFRALKGKMVYEEGTVLFDDVVHKWFKMMNVKFKYAAIKHRDDSRSSWTLDCATFHDLHAACDVIASCRWNGTGSRQQKLTKFTADPFLTTTKFNIAAATILLTDYHFQYIVPSIFSQDPLENFFGQARQRCRGNFYIDIADVVAAAKVPKLHQLLKLDILSELNTDYQCKQFTQPLDDTDLQELHEVDIEDTQNLIQSTDNLNIKWFSLLAFLKVNIRSIHLKKPEMVVWFQLNSSRNWIVVDYISQH